MSIVITLLDDLERDLRSRINNLDAQAREAFAVEMYRQRRLTHFQFSQLLGISRFEADAILKRHEVYEDMTLQDVLRDAEASRNARERWSSSRMPHHSTTTDADLHQTLG